ncbi:hypothetical protein EJ02DRAFT_256263 [Clathrospora elynae]|uniref:Phosphatidylinositol N-acetylglucosaminyltransferase subunit H conserved domain-containing protein n=1 Tax=Clathrospora elynae TaxID=706981 RepID=A0A6A5SFS4_9PLEO|nr:hypothetical protein EJ02DRAFT_256263 [Clathrospora elynae]
MSALLQRLTSPPAQTLRTLQPTSSTITYTVSTRHEPNALPAKLGYCVGILLRVLLGLSTVVLLWTKWRVTSERSTSALQWVGGIREAQLVKLAENCNWRYIGPSALGVLFLVFRRGYTESLTLLRGLGVQISTTSSTYLQTPTTRFIPTTSIQDVFINEAFKGFEVRFYLVIVVEGEGDVVVVFPTLLPRRGVLEVVWRGTRACLWEPGVQKSTAKSEGRARICS